MAASNSAFNRSRDEPSNLTTVLLPQISGVAVVIGVSPIHSATNRANTSPDHQNVGGVPFCLAKPTSTHKQLIRRCRCDRSIVPLM